MEQDLPSDLNIVDPTIEKFQEDAKNYGWSGEDLGPLPLAYQETLANAMKHGNKLDPAKSVHVTTVFSPEEIKISVMDQGQGFKDTELDDPLEGEHILKNSGRGIFLIKNLLGDGFSHRTITAEDEKTIIGHEVTLVKRRADKK